MCSGCVRCVVIATFVEQAWVVRNRVCVKGGLRKFEIHACALWLPSLFEYYLPPSLFTNKKKPVIHMEKPSFKLGWRNQFSNCSYFLKKKDSPTFYLTRPSPFCPSAHPLPFLFPPPPAPPPSPVPAPHSAFPSPAGAPAPPSQLKLAWRSTVTRSQATMSDQSRLLVSIGYTAWSTLHLYTYMHNKKSIQQYLCLQMGKEASSCKTNKQT